jgi:hypothetical protein
MDHWDAPGPQGGSIELVRLVGVSISLEKNFYRLSFTPPLWSPNRSFRERTGRWGCARP